MIQYSYTHLLKYSFTQRRKLKLKRLNVNISDEVYKEFKMKCMEKDVTMTETVEFLVRSWTQGKLKYGASEVPVERKSSASTVEEQSEPKLDTENLPSWSQVQEPEWVPKQEELEKKVQSEYDVKLTGEKADILSEFFSSRD